jgi:hypothetical protein
MSGGQHARVSVVVHENVLWHCMRPSMVDWPIGHAARDDAQKALMSH